MRQRRCCMSNTRSYLPPSNIGFSTWMPSFAASNAIAASATAPHWLGFIDANTSSRPGQKSLKRSVDRARRGLAPELLQAVEGAGVGGEDVDDRVQVVHQHPARFAGSFRAARDHPVALQVLVDRVVDCLRLALGVARADHEEVRVSDHPAHVEHADVDRLAVRGDRGDPIDERLAGQGGGGSGLARAHERSSAGEAAGAGGEAGPAGEAAGAGAEAGPAGDAAGAGAEAGPASEAPGAGAEA